MEPISVAAATFSISGVALKTTWEFIKIAVEIDGAPENALVFVRLVQQIKQDLEHALACREEILQSDRLSAHAPHYSIWVRTTIQAVMFELQGFTRILDAKTEGRDLKERVSYLLFKYPELVHKERGLRIAHSRLLQALGMMHLLLLGGGGGPSVTSPGLYGAPSTSSGPSRPVSAITLSPPPPWSEKQQPLRRKTSSRAPIYSQTGLSPAQSPRDQIPMLAELPSYPMDHTGGQYTEPQENEFSHKTIDFDRMVRNWSDRTISSSLLLYH
ncbi:hypothetical protein G7054_g3490 [Neopestalotiopsis clavispora]|nr:hypothetical protein G7054_g3490 [Neopestalotiopsis clavispora]